MIYYVISGNTVITTDSTLSGSARDILNPSIGDNGQITIHTTRHKPELMPTSYNLGGTPNGYTKEEALQDFCVSSGIKYLENLGYTILTDLK